MTLRCSTPTGEIDFRDIRFAFRKNNLSLESLLSPDAPGGLAELRLPHLKNSDAGEYTCDYYRTGSPTRRSPPSDGLLLLVTGGDGVLRMTRHLPRTGMGDDPENEVEQGPHLQCRWAGEMEEDRNRAGPCLPPGLVGGTAPSWSQSRKRVSQGSVTSHTPWEPARTTSLSGDPRLLPMTSELPSLTGHLPKSSLQAHQSGEVAAGEDVILQCQKPRHVLEPHMFALLKKGTSTPIKLQRPVGMEADFSLRRVTGSDTGDYSCVYFQPRAPFWASEPSDHLAIWVTGKVLTIRGMMAGLSATWDTSEGGSVPTGLWSLGKIRWGKGSQGPEPVEQWTGTPANRGSVRGGESQDRRLGGL